MTEKVVEIIKHESTLSVDKDSVTAYGKDTIRWISKESDFELTFIDGSPFEGHATSGNVVMGRGEATGPHTVRDVRRDDNYDSRNKADGRVVYKYAVQCGGITLDPEIIVDPTGP